MAILYDSSHAMLLTPYVLFVEFPYPLLGWPTDDLSFPRTGDSGYDPVREDASELQLVGHCSQILLSYFINIKKVQSLL